MQSGPTATPTFDNKIIDRCRNCEKHHRVVAPRKCETTVKQGMESSLAATTGTIISGKHLKRTLQRRTRRWVMTVIVPAQYHDSDSNGCNNRYRGRPTEPMSGLHQPIKALMNIMGSIPRAIDIITSHAAHSDAFLALPKSPRP